MTSVYLVQNYQCIKGGGEKEGREGEEEEEPFKLT